MNTLVRARRATRGFSMIELMVTVVLAGIVFAAMVPMFVSAQQKASGDQVRVVALNVAQDRLEKVRQLDFDQITQANLESSTFYGNQFGTTATSYSGSSSRTYAVGYVVTTSGGGTSTAPASVQVVVTVTWTAPPRPVKPVTLATIVSRQSAGPQIVDMVISPLNSNGDINGTSTTLSATVSPLGTNRANTAKVVFTVAAQSNPSLRLATLTATTGTGGVYTVTWDEAGAVSGTTYVFDAYAVSNQASADIGNTWERTAKLVLGQAPSPVTNFTIAQGDKRLLLKWDASTASDFSHYELYRGTSSGSESPYVDDLTAAGYIDTGLVNGTTYYYKVRVVDTDGNTSSWVSASKAPASQTDVTAPAMPGAFAAVRSNDTAVLTWVAPADITSVAGYFIYRDGVATPYVRWPASGTAGSTITYIDKIGWSLAHTYSVVAFDAVGLVSAATSTLTVGTGTPPNYALTVTVNKSSPQASVNVVQTDALPTPIDCGTKSATNTAPAAWASVPYGAYKITATWNGTVLSQNISLVGNQSISFTF